MTPARFEIGTRVRITGAACSRKGKIGIISDAGPVFLRVDFVENEGRRHISALYSRAEVEPLAAYTEEFGPAPIEKAVGPEKLRRSENPEGEGRRSSS